MFHRTRLTSCLAAAMLTTSGAAIAADYDPPIFVEEAPSLVPVEIGSGWYLRGDVGYSLKSKAGSFGYRTFNAGPPITYGSGTFDTASVSNGFSFGAGFGYHFNDWLRADATIERFKLDFDGTRSNYPQAGWRTVDAASAVAYSLMINGYVDLGTFSGITPYAGAGIGYTHVKWNGLNSAVYDAADAFTGNVAHGGIGSWRFTYALMAGVAYDITDNMKIDLGYKFRRVANGNMHGWNAANAAAGATGIQGRDGTLNQHEVRIGLRYDLW